MGFRRAFWLMVTSSIASSLGVLGWWQWHGFQVEAQTPIQSRPTDRPQRSPDVPYVPTPQEVVDEMLKMANVTQKDLVYDQGYFILKRDLRKSSPKAERRCA